MARNITVEIVPVKIAIPGQEQSVQGELHIGHNGWFKKKTYYVFVTEESK